MTDHGLDLAVIGNGRTAALVDPTARLVWWCYPRFDRDPIFCRLLSGDEEKGFSDVVLDDMADFQSEYLRNTAVVSTVLTDRQGGAVRITDFAPRFRQFGRVFRPPQLIRMIEPVAGLPRITIRFRPTHDYGHAFTHRSLGSNHIRYTSTRAASSASPRMHRCPTSRARLRSSSPARCISCSASTSAFRTTSRPPAANSATARSIIGWIGLAVCPFLTTGRTKLSAPAITLKLSNFEETGGIIAAHTTSIPEAPGSGRTWDYRYCWLRDAYFVVKALNRIGATQTMEDFISFTLGIASNPNEPLRPVYSVVPIEPMDEKTAPRPQGLPWRRASAHRQCRRRAGAKRHLMAASFSRRCPCSTIGACRGSATKDCFGCSRASAARRENSPWRPIMAFGNIAGDSASTPTRPRCAGRGGHRLAAIAERLDLPDRAAHWNAVAEPVHQALLQGAWNDKRQAFTAAFGSEDLDASVLLLPDLGVIEADDPRFVSTVKAMERELLREKHVMRYASADDFGLPATAFLICRFWLVDAWWSLGRRDEARDLFVDALAYRNRYGLLSEDIDPQTGTLWGNFPQTYSMAGLILTAMRLSRSWEDRYWRG